MKIYQLGDLQYAIMRILWIEGEATASEVHNRLYEERGLAPTTIATMLSKMEKKGVVRHRTEGRQYVYQAAVTEGEVRRSMVGEFLERVFQGDAAELVNHLVNERGIDPEELEQLKKLIKARAGDGAGDEEGEHDGE